MAFFELFKILMYCGSDVVMIPSLQIMLNNKRHFELFIGIFFILSKLLFNLCQALSTSLFLDELAWHFISDIMSITYALMLLIHIVSVPDENVNIIARYVAFGSVWIAKGRDKWDSAFWEALVVAIFLSMAIARYSLTHFEKSRPKINIDYATRSAIAVGVSLLFFLLLESSLFAEEDAIKVIISGILNISAGIAAWYGWKAVPCRKFKDDEYSVLSSNFV